jgi:hypothetical protein
MNQEFRNQEECHEQSRPALRATDVGSERREFSLRDLCKLLVQLGYTSRQAKGSHIIFQRGDSFLNLQSSTGGRAKAYQVRQVRMELQHLELKP